MRQEENNGVTSSKTDQSENTNTATIPAKLTTSRGFYRAVGKSVKKGRKILKDSPLAVLGLSQRKIPSVEDVVEQSRLLCEDYLYKRLEEWRGEMDMELGGSSSPVHLTDVSREIQLIGSRLEAKYPILYQNVSKQNVMSEPILKYLKFYQIDLFSARKIRFDTAEKKVGIQFKSDSSIRRTLTTIGDVMFRYQITWGRVVALFSVAGGMAVEVVQGDNPQLLKGIVETFSEVIRNNVAGWICQQGGWVEITKTFRFNQETRSLWVLTCLGVALGYLFTWITTTQI